MLKKTICAIAVALSYPLPRWLGADDAIAADASIYFRIVGYSMPFLLSSTLISSIIRCMGDTKTPMLLNILINVLNVILNTLFIYPTRTVQLWGWEFQMWGAGMGVAGAAIGSAVATGVVSILLLLVLFCKDTPIRIRLRGESYRFSKTCLLAVTKLGVPVALERSTLCVAQIVITLIISSLGTTAIAANHLAVTAEALSYLPANGIAAAATTLVGQAFGAANPRLAIRFGRLSTYLGMAFMTATGVLLYLFAPELISLFTQDADVIQLGTVVLRIEAFAQPLFAASIVASGALRGAGDTKYPFFISLVSMWGVRITLSALIAPHFGLSGVWLAMCIELCVRGAIFLVRLHRGKWLRPNSLQQ